MNGKFIARIDRLSFPDKVDWVLREIALDFTPGELVFLSGTPGSGKSSLCQILAGVIPHFNAGIFEGNVLLNGEHIVVSHLPEVAGKVGYLKDDPQSQLFCETVEEDLSFGPCSLLLSPDQVRERIQKCLEFVGLEGYEKRKTETLSGGEAQRIALASMLTLDPIVIILDEAVTQLDTKGKREVYEKLQRLAIEEKKIIIITEERVESYLYLASRLFILDKGKITYDGCPNREALIVTPKPAKSHKVIKSNKVLDKSNPIIRVNNVSFRYPNDQLALQDISLDVYPGEFIALMGQNGAGKTTFAKHFNGLHQPSKGDVLINEMNTKDYSIAQLSNQVGYLFQNPQMQICTNSVEEEIGFALQVRRMPKKEIASKVQSLLSEMELSKFSKQHPYTLAKGDVQKLALASSLINDPKIIIIDEPTSQMNRVQSYEVMELISQYHQRGVTVIMISHDLQLAFHYSSRILVLDHGQIALDIPTKRCAVYKEELLELGLDIKEVNNKGEKIYEAIVGI